MNKAAFYDLDGTLLSCNLVTMHAYYARNDRSLVKSVYQLTKVLLSVPLLFGLDLYSRSMFNVFSFRAYKGMHRDRLRSQDAMLVQAVYSTQAGARKAVVFIRGRLGYVDMKTRAFWSSLPAGI